LVGTSGYYRFSDKFHADENLGVYTETSFIVNREESIITLYYWNITFSGAQEVTVEKVADGNISTADGNFLVQDNNYILITLGGNIKVNDSDQR
jgi:hypothetical protein